MNLTPYTAFTWDENASQTRHVSPTVRVGSPQYSPINAANELNKLPVGRRVGIGQNATNALWGVDKIRLSPTISIQSPFLDRGTVALKTATDKWNTEYTAANGPLLDFVALDDEQGLQCWSTSKAGRAAIAADPRWPALQKQFNIGENSLGNNYDPQFDRAVQWLKQQAIQTALGKAYPYSNYDEAICGWMSAYRNFDGWQPWSESTTGGIQSPCLYDTPRQIAWEGRNDGTNPNFATNPLATVIWMADNVRVCAQSDEPIIPWFAPKSWAGDVAPCPLVNTPYWDELLFHCLLSAGSTNCLLWSPTPLSIADAMGIEGVMAELEGACNGSLIDPVDQSIVEYNSNTLVSGVSLESGKRVLRVTVQAVEAGDRVILVTLPGDRSTTKLLIPAGQVGVWVSL